MQKKYKEYPIEENILVQDFAAEGNALTRINDIVVFIDNAVPGDIVDLKIKRKKKNYWEATAIKFIKYSEARIEPFCNHFGMCGGCKWQHLKYSEQLRYKQEQVEDNLQRIGKVEVGEMIPILGSSETQHYRNKLEFTFSNKRYLTPQEMNDGIEVKDKDSLGFHVQGRFDKVLDIEKCYLQPEPCNSIRLEIKKYAKENNLEFFDIKDQQGFLRNVIIRNNTKGEFMLIFSFFKYDKNEITNILNHISQKFPQIVTILYVINSKRNDTILDLEVNIFKGDGYLLEEMENLKFKISPLSFFQTNSKQAVELYRIARNFAQLTGNEIVYDLYTGTGTIANFVAANASKVVGVEYVPSAIEDAIYNSQLNKITNTSFYVGDLAKIFTDDFISKNGKPDVIITDPPRSGMHPDVVAQIIKVAPKRVVYVSCNPATQARDLQMMSEYYHVVKVQAVDMFPHTMHVENVALLEKK